MIKIVLLDISALMEILSAVLVIHALKKDVPINKKNLVLLFVLETIFFTICNYFALPEIVSYGGFIFFYLYVRFSYENDFLRSLVLMIIGFVIAITLEVITALMANYLGLVDRPALFSLFASSFLLILSIIICKFLPLYKIMELFERWDTAYAIVSFLSLAVFVPLTAKKIASSLYLDDYVYIFICIAVMWVLISQIQKYKTEDKIRKQYYEGYAEVISQIRKSQHKFKNQMGVVLSLCETCHSYEELVESQMDYMGRLTQCELPNDAIVLEEPAVVALIYDKLMEAYEENIEVESEFLCSLAKTKVSDIVWVDVLGVVLDNAIEAIKELGKPGKIWISFKEEKGKVKVEIDNTYRPVDFNEVKNFYTDGYTTKGKGHGIGLHHIKKLIEKNHGQFAIRGKKREGKDCVSAMIIL